MISHVANKLYIHCAAIWGQAVLFWHCHTTACNKLDQGKLSYENNFLVWTVVYWSECICLLHWDQLCALVAPGQYEHGENVWTPFQLEYSAFWNASVRRLRPCHPQQWLLIFSWVFDQICFLRHQVSLPLERRGRALVRVCGRDVPVNRAAGALIYCF